MGLVRSRVRVLVLASVVVTLVTGAAVALADGASPATSFGDSLSTVRQNAAQTAATANSRQSTIKFCNYGGFTGEGAISFYRTWSGATPIATGGPWTTQPLDTVTHCQSFTVPAGQGISAAISLHEINGTAWADQHQGWVYAYGQDGHATSASQVDPLDDMDETIIAEFELAATYTNVEFDLEGTTCDPYYLIHHNDPDSAGSTAIVEMDESQHCGSDMSGGLAHIRQSNADIEKLTAGLPTLLRTIYDSAFH